MGIRTLSLLENPSAGQLKPVNAIYISLLASYIIIPLRGSSWRSGLYRDNPDGEECQSFRDLMRKISDKLIQQGAEGYCSIHYYLHMGRKASMPS